MLRTFCIAKIHRVKITKTDLNYAGSIGIDKALLHASGISPMEVVRVFNVNTGERFETYTIEEKENSGTIALYGPASRLGQVGDPIIIITYAQLDDDEAKRLKPKIIKVDDKNRIV